MKPGRLIAIVGPSGVGKDSILTGIKDAMPKLHLVRRVITRASDKGGEDHEAVSRQAFAKAVQRGAFCVHWRAHDLSYGIPKDIALRVDQGQDCLANLSRGALLNAAQVFPNLIILNITAAPETLAQRLSDRGRETAQAIAKRLDQANRPIPKGLDIRTISNDGPLEQTIIDALQAIVPLEERA